MIGLGTWEFQVDTMFYKGAAVLGITGEGGEYAIKVNLPDMANMPEIAVADVTEDEGTLNGIATTDMLKGKDIPCSITFDGDAAEGFLKVPFIGKLKLKDGRRVA
ncbi:MAG: hypothetical protein LBB75_07755 [Oscillospiraceae bacterium]|jgi:hypothetical protein|nr:hypothetical protein [Oscillospiraceae bacterium]